MNNICSKCHKQIESTTQVHGTEKQPIPGAISICFYCGQVCVFKDDLSLRNITQDELNDIAVEDPVIYKMIMESVKYITERTKLN